MLGYVYILVSEKNGRYYVGSSFDPKKRLVEFHNCGKVKATKYMTPWKIVFVQQYEDVSMARKIERRIKTLKSRKIIEKIIEDGKCNIITSG
ncbi:MAG: GIY-YIG nuclease family protein [Candidatus Shapirobacteria bacterium]|jgi:predicted GIY-YIG superfamily endonuclease